ncbi:MAG: hypothetical protein Sapg2KO_50060 [Saprospiraceae bacterium]
MRNHKKRNQAYLIAIGIVTLLLLSMLSFSMGWFSNQTVERTEIKEKRGFQLPDGSFIELNADSRVSFNEATFPEKKIIELEGEAFFVVKRGQPFLVKTDYGYVRSSGTQFGVYARPDGFDATCYLGKVEVIKTEETLVLGINEQAFWKDGQFNKQANYRERPDWIDGESVFNEAPFLQAIGELERQYGLKVVLDITGNPPFTGGIPHNEIQTAVDNLVEPYGYRYHQEGNTLRIWEP